MMDSFALPFEEDRFHVQIAFSGGRTSAMMLHHILEANNGIPSRAVVTFQNTGREMPQTLDFVQEVGERWGVNIVWLEYFYDDGPKFHVVDRSTASVNGEPFEQLIRAHRFLPNPVTRFCTTELKIRTVKRYLLSLEWEHWWNAIGFRADEPTRIKPTLKERWQSWSPMFEAGLTRHDVADFWKAQPFDLELPNVGGNCWLGNCDGCFLKSEASLYSLARDYPERHGWWEGMEGLADDFSKTSQRNGGGHRFRLEFSRRSLRRLVETQGDFFERHPGLLCQADEGECFG